MAWRIGIDFGRSASLVPFSFDAFLVCIRERRFDPGLYSYFSHRTISSTDSKNLHLDDWLSLSLSLSPEGTELNAKVPFEICVPSKCDSVL